MQIDVQDVLQHLSDRGRLEWEAAVLRAENAALQQALLGSTDEVIPDNVIQMSDDAENGTETA